SPTTVPTTHQDQHAVLGCAMEAITRQGSVQEREGGKENAEIRRIMPWLYRRISTRGHYM
ncbi:hypothetical protein SISSUDRAFT_1052050, partial [Sistotremastrum suecicum HHB10207 ss-3]